LLQSITPHHQFVKIGDGAPSQTSATEALKRRIQKITLLCLNWATSRVTRNDY
jgi:hypothetical protein